MNRILTALAGFAVIAVAACEDTPTSPAALALDSDDIRTTVDDLAKPGFSDASKPGNATIVQLAQATPALSTLVTAIGISDGNCGTNFGATLATRRGQYTVFAPTNAAFDAAFNALGVATVLSCDVLPTVLAYHVTRGRFTSNTVLARNGFRMLSGEYAAVSGTTVGGAPLNLGLIDISASNGVVHVVDAVLVPPSIL